MRTILVTGARGFIGRNLCVALGRVEGLKILEFNRGQSPGELPELARQADFVFHLAGVNRPREDSEFETGNADLTRELCAALSQAKRRTPIVLSSSIQAGLDNPYGRSKRAAESAVAEYAQSTGAAAYVYRLPGVFGKWSRPDYNTVVATFCHRLCRGQPLQVSNPANQLRLVYVDDVVASFLAHLGPESHSPGLHSREVAPEHAPTLGRLHDILVSIHEGRTRGILPDLADPLVKALYTTYLAFLDTGDFARPADLKSDSRGWLFELVKSPHAGQIFVSRTRPGITRGNHYHDSKVEKFCVIQGEGIIRFREIGRDAILEYPVNDREIRIVDIPPGYTHSIENVGAVEMITLFWANEIFDPARPDTCFVPVDPSAAARAS